MIISPKGLSEESPKNIGVCMKIKCWECGKIVDLDIAYSSIPEGLIFPEDFSIDMPEEPNHHGRYYCPECGEKAREEEKHDIEEFVRLKKLGMFRRALRLLEKQNADMYEYKEAIKVVEDFMKAQPDKFDSSYEMLAAIVLVKNRIHAKMQYKIGSYQVDFLLPDKYVVLEIDGMLHNYHKKYDSARDTFIKEKLGIPWEIIRIKTNYLDQNAQALPKAIDEVIKYREDGKVNWRRLYG